tara:strand:- start:8790 stop:10460 length:1671 start_codon:yes stop_codon:yes gene_type:complete
MRPRDRDKDDHEIAPDEIFLDSSNLPEFDTTQFEGRFEKSIGKQTFLLLGLVCVLVGILFIAKLWTLQVTDGETYVLQSDQNRLSHSLVFAERGVIYDRNGVEIAWNVPSEDSDFSLRAYDDRPGLGHVVGYVGYPLKDKSGTYYQEEFSGIAGVEKALDNRIGGHNGLKIIETDVFGSLQSESSVYMPEDGEDITLTVDARLNEALYGFIRDLALNVGFVGGSGVLMDVESGEIITLVSYPEYSSQVLVDGVPKEEVQQYVNDSRKPFLNRAVAGLYTPGSIVKPFLAVGVLEEGIINPEKEILSTGSISVPHPYAPGKFSVFKDWKVHGLVDMRDAISVSSNVYFYTVGGGFESQKGIGIEKIGEYMKAFGIGVRSGIELSPEADGVVPNPEWKEANFLGDEWRLGDTYNTSIGQYGFQITPVQAVRAVSAIANRGTLMTPTLVLGEETEKDVVGVDDAHLKIVQEGMRRAVTSGTARSLAVPGIKIAAKTGTAEVASKRLVNSWIIGFFPYESPRYAFAALMERGPSGGVTGAPFVMREFFEWMGANTPEYIK